MGVVRLIVLVVLSRSVLQHPVGTHHGHCLSKMLTEQAEIPSCSRLLPSFGSAPAGGHEVMDHVLLETWSKLLSQFIPCTWKKTIQRCLEPIVSYPRRMLLLIATIALQSRLSQPGRAWLESIHDQGEERQDKEQVTTTTPFKICQFNIFYPNL